MAGRVLNRRILRQQADDAALKGTPPVATEGVADEQAPVAKPKKARKPAAPRKPRAPKAPPRMRARWCIYDGSMKPIAVFDYNQRAAADAKLADLAGKAKGVHFIQIVKEEMPKAPPVG